MSGDDASDGTPRRRLSDTIVKAFYQACVLGNASAADHLIRALEAVFSFEARSGIEERRAFVDLLGQMRRDLLNARAAHQAKD